MATLFRPPFLSGWGQVSQSQEPLFATKRIHKKLAVHELRDKSALSVRAEARAQSINPSAKFQSVPKHLK